MNEIKINLNTDTKAKKHLSFNEIKKIDKIARKEALR